MAAFQKGQLIVGLLRSYRLVEPAHARTNTVWGAYAENGAHGGEETKVIIKTARPYLLRRERDHLSVIEGQRNIRQVIDNVSNPDCMVLEYMETDLWSEACKRKLHISEVKTIAKQVLEGLSWAHSKNLVHTDLKPQNILLAGFSNTDFDPTKAFVKIADWANSSMPSRHEISPPAFRSPECWLELPWGAPADIWSFGAIIGSLLMGPRLELYSANIHSKEGEYPQAMIQRAGNDWPEIFRHFKEIKEQYKAEGKQYWEWRWMMRELGIKDEDGAFVERVLKIDPDERPTAVDLLKDEWFKES